MCHYWCVSKMSDMAPQSLTFWRRMHYKIPALYEKEEGRGKKGERSRRWRRMKRG